MMAEPWIWLLLGVAGVVKLIVQHLLRERRERQALTLSPAVYQAGGDAADVIRAINGHPRHLRKPGVAGSDRQRKNIRGTDKER